MSFQTYFDITFFFTNFTMMKIFTVSSFLAEIELMEITYLFAFHFKDISEYYKLILKLSTLDVATSVVVLSINITHDSIKVCR